MPQHRTPPIIKKGRPPNTKPNLEKRNHDAEAAASALHLYNSQEYRLEDLEAFMEEDEKKPKD